MSASARIAASRSAVPTGTVDLPTTRSPWRDVRQQGVDGGVDVREVGGDLALELRRAHADEVHLGALHVGDVVGERQPAGGERLVEQLGQTGLEERRVTRREGVDLGLVGVDTDDLVAERGHARCVDGTEVPASDN